MLIKQTISSEQIIWCYRTRQKIENIMLGPNTLLLHKYKYIAIKKCTNAPPPPAEYGDRLLENKRLNKHTDRRPTKLAERNTLSFLLFIASVSLSCHARTYKQPGLLWKHHTLLCAVSLIACSHRVSQRLNKILRPK